MSRKKIDFTVTDSGVREFVDGKFVNPGDASAREGARRAARLLLALGPDQAALILKEMKENEIELLIQEMSSIKNLSPDEKKEIIEEFEESVHVADLPSSGGPDTAREILRRSFGDSKADEIMDRINRPDLREDFLFLEQIEPTLLASALQKEHPQIAAVALSFIRPRISAEVMKLFAPDFRSQTAIRIAKTSNTHPDAVLRVAKVLREKFEKRKEEIYSETGGAETLANILNHMDRRAEEEIMNVLGTNAPDLMENVRERLYTFEELIHLDSRELRLLIAKINDDRIIGTALRGSGEELRRHFFNSMSQNRAADMLDIMESMGPITIREVNDARSFVVGIARRLDEEGSIVVKKDKEEYI